MTTPPPDSLKDEIRRVVVSGAAARMRAHRARLAAGVMVVNVEVDEVNVAEALIAEGYLDQQAADDRDNVSAALTAMLRDWANRYA